MPPKQMLRKICVCVKTKTFGYHKKRTGISWSPTCVSVFLFSTWSSMQEWKDRYLPKRSRFWSGSLWLVSAFCPFFSSCLQINYILGLKVFKQSSKTCECLCFVPPCMFWAVDRFNIVIPGFVLLAEKVAKQVRPTCRSTWPSIVPEILNCFLCVGACSWIKVWVFLRMRHSLPWMRPICLRLPCACCLLTNSPVVFCCMF